MCVNVSLVKAVCVWAACRESKLRCGLQAVEVEVEVAVEVEVVSSLKASLPVNTNH